jgi:hypothetical protein
MMNMKCAIQMKVCNSFIILTLAQMTKRSNHNMSLTSSKRLRATIDKEHCSRSCKYLKYCIGSYFTWLIMPSSGLPTFCIYLIPNCQHYSAISMNIYIFVHLSFNLIIHLEMYISFFSSEP